MHWQQQKLLGFPGKGVSKTLCPPRKFPAVKFLKFTQLRKQAVLQSFITQCVCTLIFLILLWDVQRKSAISQCRPRVNGICAGWSQAGWMGLVIHIYSLWREIKLLRKGSDAEPTSVLEQWGICAGLNPPGASIQHCRTHPTTDCNDWLTLLYIYIFL